MAVARARGSTVASGPKTRSDAYVGILVVSLLAMIVASVLLYLDYSQYSGKPKPNIPKAGFLEKPPPAAGGQPGSGVGGGIPGAGVGGGVPNVPGGGPPGGGPPGGAGAAGGGPPIP